MIDEEIEIIEKELNEMYEINNKIEEPTYKLKRTYYTNKN